MEYHYSEHYIILTFCNDVVCIVIQMYVITTLWFILQLYILCYRNWKLPLNWIHNHYHIFLLQRRLIKNELLLWHVYYMLICNYTTWMVCFDVVFWSGLGNSWKTTKANHSSQPWQKRRTSWVERVINFERPYWRRTFFIHTMLQTCQDGK